MKHAYARLLSSNLSSSHSSNPKNATDQAAKMAQKVSFTYGPAGFPLSKTFRTKGSHQRRHFPNVLPIFMHVRQTPFCGKRSRHTERPVWPFRPKVYWQIAGTFHTNELAEPLDAFAAFLDACAKFSTGSRNVSTRVRKFGCMRRCVHKTRSSAAISGQY